MSPEPDKKLTQSLFPEPDKKLTLGEKTIVFLLVVLNILTLIGLFSK